MGEQRSIDATTFANRDGVGIPTTARNTSRPEMASSCALRRVYIDLGTNWVNTIMQYRGYEPEFSREHGEDQYSGWEVYGFEASPLIQPYVEERLAWLDGRRTAMPVLCVPPTGSTKHLAKWAPLHQCPATPADKMRQCMWEKLKPHLAALKPSPRLNDSNLVEARLRTARRRRCRRTPFEKVQGGAGPNGSGGSDNSSISGGPHSSMSARAFKRTRFTFVPAAAAASSAGKWLRIWSPAEQTIRGGGLPTGEGVVDNTRHAALPAAAKSGAIEGWFYVRAVDIGAWLLESFAKRDHVVIKMDIEGNEHALVREMIASGAVQLVDVWHLECHSAKKADCTKLKKDVLRVNPSLRLLNDASVYHQKLSDIDDEARLPSEEELRKRTAACSSASAGGFLLSQPAEPPEGASSDEDEDDTTTSIAVPTGNNVAMSASSVAPLRLTDASASLLEDTVAGEHNPRTTIWIAHANHRAWRLHFVYEPFIRTLTRGLGRWFRIRVRSLQHQTGRDGRFEVKGLNFPNATRGDVVIWIGQFTIGPTREYYLDWESLRARGLHTVYYQTEPLPHNRSQCWSTRTAQDFCVSRLEGFHSNARCKWPSPFTTDEVWDYSRANVALSCSISKYVPPAFFGVSGDAQRARVASIRRGADSSFFFGRTSNRKPECIQGLQNTSFVNNVHQGADLAKTVRRFRTLINLHKSHKTEVGCEDPSLPLESARVSQVLSAGPVHIISERSNPLDECMYEGIVTFVPASSIRNAERLHMLTAQEDDESIRERRQRFIERFEPSRVIHAAHILEGWCSRFGGSSGSKGYCEWLNFRPRIEHCKAVQSL